MREQLALVLAAAVLSAGGARADDPPNPPSPPPPPGNPALLVYYPPAARAANIEGSATLHCGRDEHSALKDCVVVSEAPPGQGFGAAALAMAARSQGNPAFNLPEPRDSPTFAVQFSLNPPSITPDLTQVPHTITNPDWLAIPDAGGQAPIYPLAALRARMKGRVVLQCVVMKTTSVDCSVASEDPTGYGFGDAALAISHKFRMRPMLLDGVPIDGARVSVPIAFAPP